jgi:hypothetical protein
MSSDDKDAQKCEQQILAIAAILPHQGSSSGTAKEPQSTASDPRSSSTAQPSSHNPPVENLIDFESRPSSTVPPEPKAEKQPQNNSNPMHPTSDPKTFPVHQSTVTPQPVGNPPKEANLLDLDDHNDSGMNDKMSNLNMNHAPMAPNPLKRTDTGTSEVDVFVDAEG